MQSSRSVDTPPAEDSQRLTHKVGALSLESFSLLLRDSGARVKINPFLLHFRSSLSRVASAFHFLYSDYPLEENGIADFHVSVEPPLSLRRWIYKQAIFLIDGQIPFEPFPQRLATPLFEWGMNWCASTRAHQHLMIHAAAVDQGGRSLILPGHPGAGKSTLCAALIHRGWRLLSDEQALIRRDDGRLIPFPRPIALKNKSIPLIGKFAQDAIMGPTYEDTVKGTLTHLRPPTSAVEGSTLTSAPKWIVFPTYQAGARTELTPFPKSRAFLQLAENSFNYHILGEAGFHTLACVMEACDCYKLIYSSLDEVIQMLDELNSAG